ncbi:hypothetical protein LUZ60_002040 [Juncus effusus]|nr:hypothetical protein LUZ60_002040 [Juncus effusus]
MASGGVAKGKGKGKAIPLDSLFSAEETAKAARRVEEAAAERRRDLERLRGFAEDNSALTSLVRRLPDEVSHDIMVPFGGVAFFPGRLIHTNEFLVLLGEGYYAERSSKQTVDILQRRGKSIDSQINSLNASISDLEAEAKYFTSTATEAAEGLVEIREEYIEDTQQSTAVSSSAKARDETEETEKGEYERVMKVLNELEKEELEAGSDDDSDDHSDEIVPPVSSDDDQESEEEEEEMVGKEDGGGRRGTIDLSKPIREFQVNDSVSAPNLASVETQKKTLSGTTKAVSFKLRDEQSGSTKEPPPSLNRDSEIEISRAKENMEEIRRSNKPIMIGSIVERNDNLAPNQPPKITSSDQASSSKPVSRFKLQKGGR